jgi:hypothetical protein
VLRRGAENRHVGETRLNRESSRSHSVFTCVIERHSRERVDDGEGEGAATGGGKAVGGSSSSSSGGGGRVGVGRAGRGAAVKVEGTGGWLTKVVFSRLNLIDLAGGRGL